MRRGKQGARVPGCLQGAPGSPAGAEGLISLAPHHGAPWPVARPLECPTRTLASALPRSGLAGQRDVPEPPPGSPGPPQVPGPCAEAHLLAACLPAVPLGSEWPPPLGSRRKWEGLEEVPQGGGLGCNCGRRKPRRRGRWTAELSKGHRRGSELPGQWESPGLYLWRPVRAHSRLRCGQESHSPGWKAESPTFPLDGW